MKSVSIEISQDVWERLQVEDSFGRVAPHNHVFQRVGPSKAFTLVTVSQQLRGPQVSVVSGLRSLEILKTTQSGFSDFHRDRFASLEDTSDRLLGTSLTAQWEYRPGQGDKEVFDFLGVRKAVQKALVSTFAGPADKGVFSPSVQQTLYLMVW